MFGIPVFFLVVIVITVLIKISISKSEKSEKEIRDAFWARENEANTTRRKDITNLDFITIPPNISSVSGLVSQEILDTEAEIRALSDKKIVNFTGMTNTELKLTYGAPNFDLLSEYDNNYTKLVRLINKYGRLLFDEKCYDKAREVLEFGVSVGTDIGSTYTPPAEIYKLTGTPEKTDDLIEKAACLNSLTKASLLEKLNAARGAEIP